MQHIGAAHTSCIYVCNPFFFFFWSIPNLLEASSYPGSLCPALDSPVPLFPMFMYSSWLIVCHNPAMGLSSMATALPSAGGQLCAGACPGTFSLCQVESHHPATFC